MGMPAPKRGQTTSWRDFIGAHMDVLAGADVFTAEVLTWRGLVTYYVLFFRHLESRRVSACGHHQTSSCFSRTLAAQPINRDTP